jgi:signal recognition particle subunit SRP19
MVSKDENKLVIWPVYFDKSVSRANGRKVASKYALEKPSSEDIAKAARSLGLNPVLEKNSSHPKTPWKQDGRILVDKKGHKQKLLIQIFNRM